jgi:hypothetical protein
MTANVINQVPFLRTSRQFPEEIDQLTVEVTKSYIDTANAVNDRTIGIFPTNVPAITGEAWFITGNQKQQTLRQIYSFSGYSPINHGLIFSNISFFTVIRAIGFDGTNYFPITYANPTIANGSVGIYVTPTQIGFTAVNPGVTAPLLVKGIAILEWLSSV